MILTISDIKNASFRRKGKGYFAEDVDAFLNEVQDSFKEIQKENSKLLVKITELGNKIEEYKQEEEYVKSALISSKKLADSSIKEANIKAEMLVNEATSKADVLISEANIKADEIVKEANLKIKEQNCSLENLKKQASSFRASLLKTYKEHLKLIDAIPAEKAPISSEEIEKVTEKILKGSSLQDIGQNSEDTPVRKYLVKPSSKFANIEFGEEYKVSSIEEKAPIGLWGQNKN